MNAIQKGFTLIELMIVVAIIGILAAIALPAYQDYTIRAQVSEGPTLAEGLKTAITEYYASNGAWPTDQTTLGFNNPIAGSYVSSITSALAVITITYGNKANTNVATGTLNLGAATDTNGDVAWVCGTAAVPAGFAASGAGGYAGKMQAKWLPNACKV